jgi:hypothetical protein
LSPLVYCFADVVPKIQVRRFSDVLPSSSCAGVLHLAGHLLCHSSPELRSISLTFLHHAPTTHFPIQPSSHLAFSVLFLSFPPRPGAILLNLIADRKVDRRESMKEDTLDLGDLKHPSPKAPADKGTAQSELECSRAWWNKWVNQEALD